MDALLSKFPLPTELAELCTADQDFWLCMFDDPNATSNEVDSMSAMLLGFKLLIVRRCCESGMMDLGQILDEMTLVIEIACYMGPDNVELRSDAWRDTILVRGE